jgi:hypothetical protein
MKAINFVNEKEFDKAKQLETNFNEINDRGKENDFNFSSESLNKNPFYDILKTNSLTELQIDQKFHFLFSRYCSLCERICKDMVITSCRHCFCRFFVLAFLFSINI